MIATLTGEIKAISLDRAVVEVGEIMGFTPTDRFRAPNLLVKHRMMKALGWTYDEDEKPNVDDWRTFKNLDV